MANEEQPKIISFGPDDLDASEEAAYREKIEKARAGGGVNALKEREPVGVVPRPSIPAARGSPSGPSSRSESGGVQPRPPGSPLLSPDTARQIQEAAAASAKEQPVEKKEEEKKGEEEKKLEQDLFDLFDFKAQNEAERILNNKKRRQEIEARCSTITIDDLILRDEVQQTVPVVPGKFEIIYRSITPEENLYIKRYLALKDQGQAEQYLLEKFGMLQLCCSVVAINGRALPDHRGQNGEIDEKSFEAKLKLLLKKSGYVVADLGINYMWFDIRVRKLLNPDALGNG